MAGKAKEWRDECEIKLISALEELDISVTSAPKNKRILELKIQNVESVFEALQRAYSQYCHKAKIALSSSESTDFIRAQVKLKVKGVAAARDIVAEGQENSEVLELETKLEGEKFQLQVEIEGKIGSLQAMGATTLLTTEQYESILGILEDCEAKLKRFMECSNLIAAGRTDAEAKKIIEDSQTFFKDNCVKLNTLKCTFLAKAPIKVETQSQQSADLPATSPRIGSVSNKQPVKIKAMECPTWDGKFRSFPRFKKMWEENISPRHEDSALHYLLCQALPKSVLDNISTLSDSADDIWKYLDEKYGKSDVVAREVMGELMSLDYKKLGTGFMQKFATLLLDTETLLKSINEIEWLISNRTVAELEDMLPKYERVEWAKQMSQIDGDTKYTRFKNFLIARKKVLENMDSIGCGVYAVSKQKCSFYLNRVMWKKNAIQKSVA